ncbi:hypothetical protein [Nocardia brevicatena]|uniref:hypothetical protein n=1 Tax=Nocardia brevicatena TaxID=37327 RepID=UPI00031889BE|nr:hypothetical protein [Nocardia brevicatena]
MIGKFEANKDLIQELTTSGARRIGNIAGIITGTVQEVTREIGEWITDAIEMNEAAAAARRDAAAQAAAERTTDLGERRLEPGAGDVEEADTVSETEAVPPSPAGSAPGVDVEVVEPDVRDGGENRRR